VRIADGKIASERGPLDGCDVIFTGPAPAIAGAASIGCQLCRSAPDRT